MEKTEKRTAEEIVATKYGLGKTLVTGHKAAYWQEAMKIYAAQELAEYKAVIKDLIPIAERHVYLHGNDDSVVNRKSIIERAHKLIDKL